MHDEIPAIENGSSDPVGLRNLCFCPKGLMAYGVLRSRRAFGDCGLSQESSCVLFLSLWHQTPNHPGRMTEDMTFEIGQ